MSLLACADLSGPTRSSFYSSWTFWTVSSISYGFTTISFCTSVCGLTPPFFILSHCFCAKGDIDTISVANWSAYLSFELRCLMLTNIDRTADRYVSHRIGAHSAVNSTWVTRQILQWWCVIINLCSLSLFLTHSVGNYWNMLPAFLCLAGGCTHPQQVDHGTHRDHINCIHAYVCHLFHSSLNLQMTSP